MPYYVGVWDGDNAKSVMSAKTEASVSVLLIEEGEIPANLGIHAPISSPSLKQVQGALEMEPGSALLFGWTDEPSRKELAAHVANAWEGCVRIRAAGSPRGSHLYGSWFEKALYYQGPGITVVAVAHMEDQPSGVWQRKIPCEDETESSLWIADLVKRPVR